MPLRSQTPTRSTLGPWWGVTLAAVAVLQGCDEPRPVAHVAGGDALAGKRIVAEIGCGVCHEIPGIPGARGTVGPTLRHFARRAYIGGNVPNQPQTLVRWVADAPAIAPATAMPPMPLAPQQARHVAAYLYTLR